MFEDQCVKIDYADIVQWQGLQPSKLIMRVRAPLSALERMNMEVALVACD